MQQFQFHLDKKCTVWFREFHSIQAGTLEEAQSIMKDKFEKHNTDDSFEFQEMLDNTIEELNCHENQNNSTEELWCVDSNKLLIDNNFKEIKKTMALMNNLYDYFGG